MNLIQFGTSYYIEDDSKHFELTYPQYQALLAYINGAIEIDEIDVAIKRIEHDQEPIPCPICKNGKLSRGMINALQTHGDASLHDGLIHSKG